MEDPNSIDLDQVDNASDQIVTSDDEGVGVQLTCDDSSNLEAEQMVVAGDVMTVDVPVPVTMASSMATITSLGGGDDVGLLMAGVGGTDLGQNIELSQVTSVAMSSHQMVNSLGGENTRTVQAVTLADGTTAFIQHPKGGKFLEGQTITLEDGSTAVVQGLSQVSNLPVPVTSEGETVVHDHPTISDVSNMADGQPIQLEDGTTALLHHTPKEGLQAIQLEDGTTAYITHPSAESLFGEAANLDSNTLSPDHLSSQVLGDVHIKAEGLQTLTAAGAPGAGPVTVIAAGLPDTKAIERIFGEKAYRCSFAGCGRLYTTTHHLKVHERSHTGVRPFKCVHEGCGKAFATGYGLKSHVRVHTGEKPYKCPEENCEKAFKTSGDLQKHVRTHTGERPFKCPFEGCDRSFTTSNIRKVHIRTHTGERPYICNEEGCGRAFASATNYKNHIRIHTGEKPYMCTVAGCGKRFTEYSSLYKHHVVHTHSKPYVCNHCGKTYRQTSTLAMHKRTAHGEDVTAESEAQLYQENQASVAVISGEDGSCEPVEKRAKFDYAIPGHQDGNTVSDGTVVINTTQNQEGISNVGELGEGQATSTILQTAQAGASVSTVNINQLPQTGNIATITMGEDGQQQIFVITDPAQLEALQQLAAQQLQPLITTDTDQAQLDSQSGSLTQTTALEDQTLKIDQLEEHVISNSNIVEVGEDSNSVEVEEEDPIVEEDEEVEEVSGGEIITAGATSDQIISFS